MSEVGAYSDIVVGVKAKYKFFSLEFRRLSCIDRALKLVFVYGMNLEEFVNWKGTKCRKRKEKMACWRDFFYVAMRGGVVTSSRFEFETYSLPANSDFFNSQLPLLENTDEI